MSHRVETNSWHLMKVSEVIEVKTKADEIILNSKNMKANILDVYPNTFQKPIILLWMEVFNRVYNAGVDILYKFKENGKTISKDFKTFKNDVKPYISEDLHQLMIRTDFPCELRDGAFIDLSKGYQSAIENYNQRKKKAGNKSVKPFHMGYKTDIRSIPISSKAMNSKEPDNYSFFVQKLGFMKVVKSKNRKEKKREKNAKKNANKKANVEESPIILHDDPQKTDQEIVEDELDEQRDPNQKRDSRLVYKNKEFKLHVPRKDFRKKVLDRKPICGIDLGGRTMATVSDKSTYIDICIKPLKTFRKYTDKKLYEGLDGKIMSKSMKKQIVSLISNHDTEEKQQKMDIFTDRFPLEVERLSKKAQQKYPTEGLDEVNSDEIEEPVEETTSEIESNSDNSDNSSKPTKKKRTNNYYNNRRKKRTKRKLDRQTNGRKRTKRNNNRKVKMSAYRVKESYKKSYSSVKLKVESNIKENQQRRIVDREKAKVAREAKEAKEKEIEKINEEINKEKTKPKKAKKPKKSKTINPRKKEQDLVSVKIKTLKKIHDETITESEKRQKRIKDGYDILINYYKKQNDKEVARATAENRTAYVLDLPTFEEYSKIPKYKLPEKIIYKRAEKKKANNIQGRYDMLHAYIKEQNDIEVKKALREKRDPKLIEEISFELYAKIEKSEVPMSRFSKKVIKQIKRGQKKQRSNQSKIKRYNRKINKKLQNLRDDMHWKVILFLVRNYDTIVIGKLSVQGIIRKDGNLNKEQRRLFLFLSPYLFRTRLAYKCNQYRNNYNEVDEYNTTKSCSLCGRINNNVGSAETFRCVATQKCGNVMGRDHNSADNMMKVHDGSFKNTREKVQKRKEQQILKKNASKK